MHLLQKAMLGESCSSAAFWSPAATLEQTQLLQQHSALCEAKEEDKGAEMRAFQGCCMQPGPRAVLEVLSGGINLRKTSLKASVGRQQNSVCHQLYKRSLTK